MAFEHCYVREPITAGFDLYRRLEFDRSLPRHIMDRLGVAGLRVVPRVTIVVKLRHLGRELTVDVDSFDHRLIDDRYVLVVCVLRRKGSQSSGRLTDEIGDFRSSHRSDNVFKWRQLVGRSEQVIQLCIEINNRTDFEAVVTHAHVVVVRHPVYLVGERNNLMGWIELNNVDRLTTISFSLKCRSNCE